MKYLLIALVIAAVGCQSKAEKERYRPIRVGDVISGKSYRNEWGNDKMPKGICRFFVRSRDFEDSCHLYNIGDTIRPREVKLGGTGLVSTTIELPGDSIYFFSTGTFNIDTTH
jgi:hypothetical protein